MFYLAYTHVLSCVYTQVLSCVYTHVLSCVYTHVLSCVYTQVLSCVYTHLFVVQDHSRIVQESWQLVQEITSPLELGDKFFKVKTTTSRDHASSHKYAFLQCHHMDAGAVSISWRHAFVWSSMFSWNNFPRLTCVQDPNHAFIVLISQHHHESRIMNTNHESWIMRHELRLSTFCSRSGYKCGYTCGYCDNWFSHILRIRMHAIGNMWLHALTTNITAACVWSVLQYYSTLLQYHFSYILAPCVLQPH